MNLNPHQHKVLAAICDTFQPPGDPGTGAPLHQRVLDLLRLLHADDLALLRIVLSAFGSRIANAALAGRWGSFEELPLSSRIAVLRDWAESRIEQRRAAFQALKRLVNIAYYGWPADGGSHPAWRAAGYPGPLPLPAHPPIRLSAIEPQESRLDCDVVIIGSGAGGGIAAGILAEAGRDVVVLEKGPNLGPADFSQVEGEMLGRAYLDHGLAITRSGSMPLLAGSCVGGGTTINWTTSFAPPADVRAEWDRIAGLKLFESAAFDEAVRRVQAISGVNTANSQPGRRDEILDRGARALGWHVEVAPRNAVGCPSSAECGYCGFGCRHGAKRSTMVTSLRGAVQRGARLIADCDVRRVIVERGRAAGVMAQRNGRPLEVRARVVIVAAGAINTPALLRRSGVENELIGRRLFLHPVTGLVGTFEERVEPWTGRLQTRYSDQFAALDGGYGVKLETGPIHWALPASAYGWEQPDQHRADVRALAHQCIIGVLLRDREHGRVQVARDGRALADYDLSTWDARHLRAGMRGVSEILAASGAREIMSIQQPPARTKPGSNGWLDDWMRQLDARGYDRSRMALFSFHQMGTAPLGADPSRGATAETGEVWGAAGLYVADGSCFPASSGVNPMITIMAIADHVARGIAARW